MLMTDQMWKTLDGSEDIGIAVHRCDGWFCSGNTHNSQYITGVLEETMEDDARVQDPTLLPHVMRRKSCNLMRKK